MDVRLFCFGIISCLVINSGINAGDQKMYLCADSTGRDNKKVKLVYGYIDDKKTACMTENELLALLGKTQFDADSSARQAQLKEMEAKSASSGLSGRDSIVDALKKGERNCEKCDLMSADLNGLDLSGANLKSADLRQAKLNGANLSNADLQAAYLKSADARNADFSGANLKNGYFAQADIRGAKGLTVELLKNTATLYKTKMDDVLMDRVKAEIPEKLKEPGKCWEGNAWSDNEDCKPDKALRNPESIK